MKFSGLHLSKNYIPSPITLFTDLSKIAFNYLCENSPNTLCHFWNHKSFFTTQLVYIILAQTLHAFDKNIPWKCKFSDFSLLKLKFIKFFMSFFKQKVSFSLNFGSLFSVMRDNSSVLFWLKMYMICTKGPHQSAKFQTFDCSHKISPNLYFDRLLKVYKVLAKKYRGVICHDPGDWYKIWRKTDLLFQKWQEFGETWHEQSQVSKTCTFICSYCAKYLMFDLK